MRSPSRNALRKARSSPSGRSRRSCTQSRRERYPGGCATVSSSRTEPLGARAPRDRRSLRGACAGLTPGTIASGGLRPLLRARALPGHGSRIRARARSPDRRATRSRRPVSVRARRRDGRPWADGNPVPRGARGGRWRHACLRACDRGAGTHRLVRRDHARRAYVARHDADLPLRKRRAETAVDPPARQR